MKKVIKFIKRNILLIAIVTTLLGTFAYNTVSSIQVATVVNTKYEIHFVYGGRKTTYSWRQLQYRNSFRYTTTSVRRDYGINPGYFYTYYYTTY
ncbi:hypothetical protein [Streptococcus loxodontisalivarius]|uniref:Uncharacterized protein n=2 Tax=Streptococcus TaxID=1301 RepID=A0ABS2PPZ3_9STRE|nr:hypothetical protein [Streptococcus loxodontisalivarius]MBM7637003.1 hypothetical protein [Streptococcus saliviloxodontae]MBM7641946.1 hypothetical protein [Streptococcus loxodontisalivarius]